jgi:CheY-like chemotaxis protein
MPEALIELLIMSNLRFPFAVRLVGFSAEESDAFAAAFSSERERGYGYFILDEDNLQDPDLYVVNATEVKSALVLSKFPPSDVRPVLLVGAPKIELPYAHVSRPLHWHHLFSALDRLIEKRADALSRLEASDVVTVPERRRRERLDDVTDAGEYELMRKKLPTDGGILVIDKNGAFSDHLAELFSRHKLPVAWTDDEEKAISHCHLRRVAITIINTSTPEIDPYRLCSEIRNASCVENTIVIFLISKPFVYDTQLAKEAGVSGFLNKPLASHHLISALKKFLPLLMR